MNYWLVKSEPGTYSISDLQKDGKTRWDGVRSFAARNHLKGMKTNDLVLFYHSGDDKSVVGISKVLKEYYADLTSEEEGWVAVDLCFHKMLKRPITLQQIKNDKLLAQIPLVRIGRLSVMPLKKEEFERILKLSE